MPKKEFRLQFNDIRFFEPTERDREKFKNSADSHHRWVHDGDVSYALNDTQKQILSNKLETPNAIKADYSISNFGQKSITFFDNKHNVVSRMFQLAKPDRLIYQIVD